ncbi:MAG: hypothetical protein KatS3mg131_1579 [Candidatus Tectimicrobiota bacterium]|nr:MAG: hypothetical protein KatS3mg131_1579 [Candidatus Tectomicrobia bacterium]
MPSVQRVHEALRGQAVAVLTISIDGGGRQAVQAYMAKHGFSVPTLIDSGMRVARQFGVRGVPTTYVVDRRGRIVASGFGPVDFSHPAFWQLIEALLDQPD